MPHVLKGRLCGYMCDDCNEPLAGLTVRIYRPLATDKSAQRAIAASPEALTFLSDDDVKAKADRLIAEVPTDAHGNYEVNLERGRYDGGPIEIDLYCRTVPRKKVVDVKPVQVPIKIWQPEWDAELIPLVWDYCLPPRWWCGILAWFGVWTVCGRLTTCEGARPIPGAKVTAFDADCIQDDTLGSGNTDANGRFRISFTANDFQKTPFSPLFNFEHGGPDLYFHAELGGKSILQEPKSRGRTPGRENVGVCTCVSLCSPDVVPDPEGTPHWKQLDKFDIKHAGTPGAPFSAEGYASDATHDTVVFGGPVVLSGNCPLTGATPGSELEYRFLYGEWTWGTGGPKSLALPTVAPAASVMEPVTQISNTHVGYVDYVDANGDSQSAQVIVTPQDVLPDGWVKLLGKPVKVPMNDGTTAIVPVTKDNFLRTFDLLTLKSDDITKLHHAHPDQLAAFPPDIHSADAGRVLTDSESARVLRYALVFEVRESGSTAVVHSDKLGAVVLDNAPVIAAITLEELLTSVCQPLAGKPNLHLLYTIDHPHLRSYQTRITNNSGVVHPAPLPAAAGSPTGSGAFAGNVLFRGGASGPHAPGGLGGVPVNIAADPTCAYSVKLSWTTRHRVPMSGTVEILYCR